MPAIPLPFITAFLLMVLFLRFRRLNGKKRAARTATAFVATSCLAITLCGLRWGTSLAPPPFLQPIAASAIPPLFWLCMTSAESDRTQNVCRFWHLLPVALVAVLAIMKTNLLDLSLVMIYGGYGIALIYAARGSSSDQPLWQKTTFLAGVYFILSGMADIAIALDLGMFGGRRAPQIIAVAHIATLMVLTFLIVTRNAAPTVISATGRGISAVPPASPDDRTLADKLDQFIRINNLYTDPNMTLQRLARRMGIPARKISEAINRVHGRNISQVMNGYRIDEARRLLSQTDSRITDIMLACGFQTKSNFNREFLKSTGISPSQWRRANASSASATSVAMPAPESRRSSRSAQDE